MTAIESPSNTALLTPTSDANDRAHTAAKASISKTPSTWCTTFEHEAIIRPLLSLITTPIPDFFSFGKSAPSKLILTAPDGGGFHLHLVGWVWVGDGPRLTCLAWYSTSQFLERWAIWWMASSSWLSRTRFRWFHMDQPLTANIFMGLRRDSKWE